MLFLATGGTIDKMPAFKTDGRTFDNESRLFGITHLHEMLDQAGYVGPRAVQTAFLLDSWDMDDHHRAQIVRAIGDSDEDKVVVTHGTDTMSDTARFLFRHRQGLIGRTVVLTGAMVPFSVDGIKEPSDAVPNLKRAIDDAQRKHPGVYVRMGTRDFDGNNVKKENGVFKTLDEQ